MPRSRRRRRRAAGTRNWARLTLEALAIAAVAVVVVGSIGRISTESSGYRTSTDAGFGALATRVIDGSNQTGTRLASLMSRAPNLPNQQTPYVSMARTALQQGLDEAVVATGQQASAAEQLVPPSPVDDVSTAFIQVLRDRADATVALRSAIDQRLGMTSLPVAGAPAPANPPAPEPLISIDQAARAMGAAGTQYERADADYRSLLATIHRDRLNIHLPRSVWVPAPMATAPLGSAALAQSASALSASAALAPYHQLVIAALGLTPPAVATGGTGVVGDSCGSPFSVAPAPGAPPTVLPPSTTVAVEVTVTNCGTVTETGVPVTETLSLADPPGTAPPPAGAGGGRRTASVTIRSGSSTAVALPSMAVASGHRYVLTVSITVPAGQADPTGSTQSLLLQITA